MTKYRNRRTGTVIEIRSRLTGADWEAMQDAAPPGPAGGGETAEPKATAKPSAGTAKAAASTARAAASKTAKPAARKKASAK